MTTEQNKEIVRRFFEAFGANDQTTLKKLLAPDLVAYSHGAPGPQDRETHLQGIGGWNAAFPDTSFTIQEQLAEGDTVATRLTLQASHTGGEFQGLPPTGEQVVIQGISLERIQNGKIAERRVSSDYLGMMQQLGLVPSPQAAE